MRAAVWLLTAQLIGVLSPLVVLAPRLFKGPHHAPTLEGQYVLKDLILVAAGMVVASTVRGGRLVRGARSAKPTSVDRHPLGAQEKLDIVLDGIRQNRPMKQVCRAHGVSEDDFRRWRGEMVDGVLRAISVPDELVVDEVTDETRSRPPRSSVRPLQAKR